MSKSTAEKETTVWARLHDKLWLFTFKAETVPDRLDLMDGLAKKNGVTEQLAMGDAVRILERGKPKKHDALFVAHNLLWTACRCPEGKTAEKAARKGGKNIGWNIACEPNGGLLYGLHILDGPMPDVCRIHDVRDAVRVPKGAMIN